MALPLPTYLDGGLASWQIATPVSQPVFSKPFPGVNIDYVLTQDFMQLKANTASGALNALHPDFGTGLIVPGQSKQGFILVAEGPQQDLGGGIVRWTRTYAKLPATYNQPQTMTYNFIGYFGTTGINITGAAGRPRLPKTVSARVQYDYFLLDQATGKIYNASGTVVFTGTAGTLPSLVNVPVIQEQKYYAAWSNAITSGAETDAIGYDAGEASPQLAYPHPPAAAAYPTRGVYESWIASKTEIVAQSSQVSRWQGNIVERATVYVLAQ